MFLNDGAMRHRPGYTRDICPIVANNGHLHVGYARMHAKPPFRFGILTDTFYYSTFTGAAYRMHLSSLPRNRFPQA